MKKIFITFIITLTYNYIIGQENNNNNSDKLFCTDKINYLINNITFSINKKFEHKETIIKKFKKGLLYNYQRFYNKDKIENSFYFYDKFGNKVLKKNGNQDEIKISYKYDKKGNILNMSEKYLSSSENYMTEYRYNKKNQIIYEKPLGDNANWVLISNYSKNKRIDTLVQNGKSYLRNIYVYNKNKLIKFKSVFEENKKLNHRIEYKYDNFNNIMEQKRFDEKSNVTSLTKWKYNKYDKFKNWLERYCYYGKTQIHEVRKIIYN